MTDAALAQQNATVIGWVNNQPIPKFLLENRLAALRAGPGAAALPAPNTREGRQLVRWTAHVLFTEHLCADWARQHNTPIRPPTELDALSAIHLGSITAAAWRTHPAVSAVYHATVNDHTEPPQPKLAKQWRLRLATGPTPQAASAAEPISIGWTTLADLPHPLAAAARTATPQKPTSPPKPAPPQPTASPETTPPQERTPLTPTPTPNPAPPPTPPHPPANIEADASSSEAAPASPHPPVTAEAASAPSHSLPTGPNPPHSPATSRNPTPLDSPTISGSNPTPSHSLPTTGPKPAPPHSPTTTGPNPASLLSPGDAGAGLTATQPAAGTGAARVPVAAGGMWHVVVVDEVDVRPIAGTTPVSLAGTALRAFARWLDEQRAGSVLVAAGFEHPGDPTQPDNTHQH